jgi:hypothetical protein
VHCTAPFKGTCGVEGRTVHIELSERPENAGAPGKDSHFAIVDTASGNEYDFWGTQWPPSNGVLKIGWGGICTLSGTGYNRCGATASGTAVSLGIIRAKDLIAAVRGGGTLPYALQASTKCADGFLAPILSSDGNSPGCPPEGARVYLAMHDAEVNASAAPGITKAILRTVDEDHYGIFITDQNGGSDGFSLVTENDVSYTAFGLPGPLVTQLVPLAISEGIPAMAPFHDVYHLQLEATGIDLESKLKFL